MIDLTDEQKEAMRLRVEHATKELNEALDFAHRAGLRSRVTSNGVDHPVLTVTLLNPVELDV